MKSDVEINDLTGECEEDSKMAELSGGEGSDDDEGGEEEDNSCI